MPAHDPVLDPNIAGHKSEQESLLRAVRSGRLAHGHLFAGPAGIGKKLVAVALAKALVCEKPDAATGAACHGCRQCRMVASGHHSDVQTYMKDKSQFSADLMRDTVLDWASRKPREGRRKVGIICDADSLSIAAANSFLKTLEEPPPGTHWILLTSDPAATLTTIRSRCQLSTFQPLTPEEMEGLFAGKLRDELDGLIRARSEKRGEEEVEDDGGGAEDVADGEGDDESFAAAAVRSGGGGARRPASRLSLPAGDWQALLAIANGSPGALLEAVREDITGLRDWLAARFSAGMRASGRKGFAGAVTAADELIARLTRESELTQDGLRGRLALAIGLSEAWLRDLLAVQADAAVRLVNADRGAVLRAQVEATPRDAVLGSLGRLHELRVAIDRNAAPKTVAANLLLEIQGIAG
jgi:hypothetical protein